MAWIDRENGFRSFSAEVAIDTSSIQLESDENHAPSISRLFVQT
jgi:hypothetical protein